MKPKPLDLPELLNAYKKSNKRMFFLDYDGTLAPIVDKPEEATPTDELKHTLAQLSNDENNRVYIISGRDRKTLAKWLGDLRVGLSAEHGCFVRPYAAPSEGAPSAVQWRDMVQEGNIDVGWKDDVVKLFSGYEKRLKGSTVECKEYAITFHYRQCEKQVSKPVVADLRRELEDLTNQFSTLQILKGKKCVEARLSGISKGVVIRKILDVNKRDGVDFVLCIGDDLTDEDMFAELESDHSLKENVFTCTVNFRGSKALTYVETQKQVLKALQELANVQQ